MIGGRWQLSHLIHSSQYHALKIELKFVILAAETAHFFPLRGPSTKRSSLRGRTKVAKAVKWGLSGRGSNLLKSDQPLRSTTPPCWDP